MYRKTVFFLLTYCLLFTILSKPHEHKEGDSCAKKSEREHVEIKDDNHDHDKDHKDEKGKKYDDDHDKDHKDEKGKKCDDDHGGEGESNSVVLTKEQLETIKLKLSKAQAGNLSTKIFLLGEVRYNRDRMAQIMPHMPGFVSKITKKEGDRIKAGETLALLQSHKLGELYAEYRSAQELELLAKKEFDIRRKLWKKKVVSEREYIKARQEYAESLVTRHRAEDKLKSLGLSLKIKSHDSHGKKSSCTDYHLKSPIDGVIISKNITIGENYPEDNEKVPFVVADLDKLWLDLNARQQDLPKLKKGMKIDVKFGKGFPDYHGTIAYIAPDFNSETRTVLVRVILDNKKGLFKPGLYATGTIFVPGEKSRIIVKRSAVQMISGEKLLFVPAGKGFAAVPVKTGRYDNGFIEILSEIKPGQEYVSQGAFELKAVMITAGMDPHAGHGH